MPIAIKRENVLWTCEEDSIVLQNWGLMSAAKISELLPGRNRNKVIGRANRLGVAQKKGSGTSALPIKPSRRRDATKKSARLRQVYAALKAISGDAPRTDGLVSLMDLEPWHCRWPVGDPHHPSFGFCGARKQFGSSYCAVHHETASNGKTPIRKR
jgi:GcrA cell cycle regulator